MTGFVESPYLFNTYRRQPVTFVKGRGAWLTDDRGKKYLDFFSGLAVCNLGHAHPAVARAVADQVKKLLHTSNIYSTQPQQALGKALVERTFPSKVFFSNSGAEANELLIKLARRFGTVNPGPEGPRYEIIVFDSAFHGRTLGALSATPQKKYQEGFGPLLPGFVVARYGDLSDIRQKATAKTCAVLVEPIQGEGGVRRVPPAFYSDLAALCREKNWLLLFDEVQTGMGRTGTLFAFQNPAVVPADARPDALSMAKGLANGLPIGGVIARPEIADLLHPGDHATTFGGGAVPCRAALAVLKELSPARLAQARKLGALFQKEISGWQKDLPALREVRGAGLMIGLELDRPVADLVVACREAGLLINGTADKVLRLLPPLILTAADARRGLKILRTVLAKSLSSQSH